MIDKRDSGRNNALREISSSCERRPNEKLRRGRLVLPAGLNRLKPALPLIWPKTGSQIFLCRMRTKRISSFAVGRELRTTGDFL